MRGMGEGEGSRGPSRRTVSLPKMGGIRGLFGANGHTEGRWKPEEILGDWHLRRWKRSDLPTDQFGEYEGHVAWGLGKPGGCACDFATGRVSELGLGLCLSCASCCGQVVRGPERICIST